MPETTPALRATPPVPAPMYRGGEWFRIPAKTSAKRRSRDHRRSPGFQPWV